MIDAIKQLVLATAQFCTEHKLVLATAESCTGGGLSYWLTSVPGSSDWLDCGFVTYSNEAKVQMLGVPVETLTTFGAVSTETAHAMANGALARSQADVSFAITGIAGPTGGTADKPVGTVWIAWGRSGMETVTKLYLFAGDRQAIRLQTIAAALTDCPFLSLTT